MPAARAFPGEDVNDLLGDYSLIRAFELVSFQKKSSYSILVARQVRYARNSIAAERDPPQANNDPAVTQRRRRSTGLSTRSSTRRITSAKNGLFLAGTTYGRSNNFTSCALAAPKIFGL